MTYTAFSDWVTAYNDMPPYPPGKSRLERLPNELLGHILQYVVPPRPTTSLYLYEEGRSTAGKPPMPPAKSLLFCLLISRRLEDAARPLLYKNVFPSLKHHHHQLFQTLATKSSYGSFVRSLDLRCCDADQLDQLPAILSICGLIKSLCIPSQLLIENASFVRTLFKCRYLESLEMISAHISYTPALSLNLPSFDLTALCTLQSLTLRCINLGSGGPLELLVSRCPNLQVLRLKDCVWGSGALTYIHENARITELICPGGDQTKVDEVVHLLTQHPAIKHSLQVLTWRMHNWRSNDITQFLRSLPPTLRSFQFTYDELASEHIPLLQQLCSRLDESSLRCAMTLKDVEEVVLGPWFDLEKSDCIESSGDEDNFTHWLSSIPTFVAVSRLQSRIKLLTLKRGVGKSKLNLKHLDLRGVHMTVDDLQNSLLLGPQSLPIQIIALPRDIIREYEAFRKFCSRFRWKVYHCFERTWLERES